MAPVKPLDQGIFKQIYDAHVGFVQFIAGKAGWSGGLADDVVQETFLRFYQHPPASLQDKAVRAWLATTARRVMIDLARKTRHERPSAWAQEVETTGTLWFRDEETLEREMELLAVKELIDEIGEMPGGEDFRAFYVEGLKAREIAEKRGEAISTVTTRLSRLRARFRDKLVMRLQKVGTKEA